MTSFFLSLLASFLTFLLLSKVFRKVGLKAHGCVLLLIIISIIIPPAIYEFPDFDNVLGKGEVATISEKGKFQYRPFGYWNDWIVDKKVIRVNTGYETCSISGPYLTVYPTVKMAGILVSYRITEEYFRDGVEADACEQMRAVGSQIMTGVFEKCFTDGSCKTTKMPAIEERGALRNIFAQEIIGMFQLEQDSGRILPKKYMEVIDLH